MAKVLLAVAATAAVGVAAFVLTQGSSKKHSEDEETDVTKEIHLDDAKKNQSAGATSANGVTSTAIGVASRDGNASEGTGKEKQNVGSPVPRAFETEPVEDPAEARGVSSAGKESARSKDGLEGDNGPAPKAAPSEMVTAGGSSENGGPTRVGTKSAGIEGERSQMPKAVENDDSSAVAKPTGVAALSPVKAKPTVEAHSEKSTDSDGHDEDSDIAAHNARLREYQDFALTPPDSPPKAALSKGVGTRAVRSSSGMAELVLKKVPSRGASMESAEKEKASTPKAESPCKSESQSVAEKAVGANNKTAAASSPVVANSTSAQTKGAVKAEKAPVTPSKAEAPVVENKRDAKPSGGNKGAVVKKGEVKPEAKREEAAKRAGSASEKEAPAPVNSAPATSTEKVGVSFKAQISEAPKSQLPKDTPPATATVKSDAVPGKHATADGPAAEKKPSNLVAADSSAPAGKPGAEAPKGGQASVQKEPPVPVKPSFAALAKSPPKHQQPQTKSSVPAPPTNSERKASSSLGSYADRAKPASGKSSSNSVSSPPPDGSRFGFVAKLPKQAASPVSSRSNSVTGSTTPIPTQVGFEVANPKPEVANPKAEVANPKVPKTLSPTAAAFVPAAQKEAAPKVSQGVNGELEEGGVKVSEGVKGKSEVGNVGSGASEKKSAAEEGKADGRKSGGEAPVEISKNQAAAKPSGETDPAVKSAAASRADAAGLSLPISIPGSVTGGEKEELLSEAETASAATTPATTPAVSPNQKGGYIEGVVWNADKTAKNKAKRDKKKAKKSKSNATTPGAS